MAEEKTPTYKKLKKYEIRTGRYPIRLSLTIWDDGKSKPFIELYSGVPTKNGYRNNNFKITNQKIWNKIKFLIDSDLINEIRMGKSLSEKEMEKLENEEVELLKKDNLRLKKRLQSYSKLIREYRNIKLPEYKKDIKDFKDKLSVTTKEEKLQKFLSERPWLLGLEYENSQPQKIGIKKRYDFYVEKYDGYADIIEIKKCTEELFNKNGKMSKFLTDALQQLIEYIDEAIIEGDSKRISKKLRVNFLKPKGILVIGKKKSREIKEKLEHLKYYFHNIDILTYDDLLERGENIVNNLENKKAIVGENKNA
ncbi:MAG: Shedu anti-phage system protein SduA domain-containing protein [Candidatus Micrarchaeia archaeon]